MTDNIIPQAPQTTAPMTTEEIIDRLEQVSFTYSRLTSDCLSAKEVARDKQAMATAIQAVKTVAAVDAAYEERDCDTCWNRDDPKRTEGAYSTPCYDCLCCEKWSLRWPLEEEETQ